MASQEQSDQIAQQGQSEGSSVDVAPTPDAPEAAGGKRPSVRKRVRKEISAEEASPRPSFWPLALAAALVVLLMGAITYPIIMGVGAVLVAIAIIGWGLERR